MEIEGVERGVDEGGWEVAKIQYIIGWPTDSVGVESIQVLP